MARDRITEMDELFDRGVDIHNRRVYWGDVEEYSNDDGDGSTAGDFNWVSVEKAIRGIRRLVAINSKKPIELHVMSPGGDPYFMMALYDEILYCPCQVKFIGKGLVGSAATWIMAVCDERYLHPNTTVLLHYGYGGHSGTHTDSQVDAKEDKRFRARLAQLYVDNSHMPLNFWQDVLQRDTHITAEEAVLMGLADKVIPPKKRGNLRRMRQTHLNDPPDKRKLNALIKRIHQRIDRPASLKTININMPHVEECDPTVKIDESAVDNWPTLPASPGDDPESKD
jgi:ATP-dependent Clp protease protease subunit